MVSCHYTSLEAELHDVFWEQEASPELRWLDTVLEGHPGRALEVGCGSGRLLLPLLAKGHAVEGLESSDEMLDLCRQDAARRQLNPVLHRADMATFQTETPFSSVLVPAFTFQYATDPSATLDNFHRLLAPAGLLYLTTFIPYAEIDGELPEGEWYADHEATLPSGEQASIHTWHQIDRQTQQLSRKHHYRLTGGTATREHRSEQTIRWYFARELASLLERAGFRIENAFADFDDHQPVDDDAQIITVIARKRNAG